MYPPHKCILCFKVYLHWRRVRVKVLVSFFKNQQIILFSGMNCIIFLLRNLSQIPFVTSVAVPRLLVTATTAVQCLIFHIDDVNMRRIILLAVLFLCFLRQKHMQERWSVSQGKSSSKGIAFLEQKFNKDQSKCYMKTFHQEDGANEQILCLAERSQNASLQLFHIYQRVA